LPLLHVHHEFAAPLAIVADGELTVASPPRVDLTIEWRDFQIPGVSDARSASGRLDLAGSVAAYTFDGEGSIAAFGNEGTFGLRGTGEAGLLDVEALTLDTLRGRLMAGGTVALDALELDVAVGVENFDLGWVAPQWPSRLTGNGRLIAELAPLSWSLESFTVDGELRGQPLRANGSVSGADGRYGLTSVELASAESRLTVDGAFGLESSQPIALKVTADVAAIEPFWPQLKGSLVASLDIGGVRSAPHASGTIEARDLSLGDYSATRVSVSGKAGLGAQEPLDLTVEGHQLGRGSIQAAAVRADLDGTTRSHRITVDASGEAWQWRSAASGGAADTVTWRGKLESVEIDQTELGTWRLADPAAVVLGRSGVVLETSCLQHESGGLWCAELALEGKPEDRLVLSAQNFELQSLAPLLPPQLELHGVYQLSASIADLSREPRGSLAISGGSTEVSVAFSERQAFTTVLEDLIVGATLANDALDLKASVMGRNKGRFDLTTRIDDVRAGDSAITGNLSLLWPDLGFLSLVTPEIGQVGGALSAELQVAGTVNEPQLEGNAHWSDGQFAVPEWGLVVARIEADATSRDGTALSFDANGWVGDSELRLSGTTTLDRLAGWPTSLTLTGDSVAAVQLREAEIFVSPDLTIEAELPDVRVMGNLHIPNARIQLSQLPETAIAPSRDAVVHGGEVSTEVRSLRLTSDILVTLGDAVEYSGLNLATKVTGELRLRVEPNASMAASGSLLLAGTYNAYGQTLELERGQLLFNGPLDDPGLDVRAVRTIETREEIIEMREVGVELLGSLKAPRTRVFSEPAASEADALSYLLFGRPVTSAGGEETSTLQTAALTMGLQQALPAVQRIGQTLGLDEFTVQATESDAGEFMAGKYLSPKVFVRYSYGLFNKIGGLLLRFRVNERFSIETRSGDQQSMDLLYTVEKD
jgi:translocation and assembly module TamB